MNLNGILIGSQDPQRLTAYYTRLFGEPGGAGGDFRVWQLAAVCDRRARMIRCRPQSPAGTADLEPGDPDVHGDFQRLKAAGATVVQEPYQPGECARGLDRHVLGSGRQLLSARQPDVAAGGRQMDKRTTKVGELLHEAAETHHQVFRITSGADDDWAYWYAHWLVTLSDLPEVLGGTVVRSE
jgi:hypothetical protein